MRRGAALVGLMLLALGALGVVVAVRPPATLEAGARTVEVPAALGVRGIARLLAERGVIRSEIVFTGLAFLRGTARSLKAGEYEVPQGAPLLAVLQLLESGRVKPHLQRVEVETMSGRDDNLAVEHALVREPFDQGVMQWLKYK